MQVVNRQKKYREMSVRWRNIFCRASIRAIQIPGKLVTKSVESLVSWKTLSGRNIWTRTSRVPRHSCHISCRAFLGELVSRSERILSAKRSQMIGMTRVGHFSKECLKFCREKDVSVVVCTACFICTVLTRGSGPRNWCFDLCLIFYFSSNQMVIIMVLSFYLRHHDVRLGIWALTMCCN